MRTPAQAQPTGAIRELSRNHCPVHAQEVNVHINLMSKHGIIPKKKMSQPRSVGRRVPARGGKREIK